jgi:S-phase kinase-associated protein 1
MHVYIYCQVSKEGKEFVVPTGVAFLSNLVKETIPENNDDEDDEDDENKPEGEKATHEVPLPNVATDILEKVVAFCTHYKMEEMTPIQTPLKSNKLDDLVQPWYCAFVKVDKNTMFDLVAAANYMDIKPLLDLSCLAVSILIKGKSAAELREMFNIAPDMASNTTTTTTTTTAATADGAAAGEGQNADAESAVVPDS